MKKFWIALSAGLILAAAGARMMPNETYAEEEDMPADKKAYLALFDQKVREFPTRTELANMRKMDRPDMFYEFYKLKRMNPVTGEIPPNAERNAFNAVKAMYGQSFMSKSNYGVQWDERGPNNVGGRTRAVMFDPNDAQSKALFAGGVGGGLWKNDDVTNGSSQWYMVSPQFGNVAVVSIAYDPTNTQVMYYGTGEGYPNADAIRGNGIWKSTDGGDSWDALASTENSSTFYFTLKIAVDPDDGTVYAGTAAGLQRSTDGGQTWTKVLGSGTGLGLDGITDIEIAGDGDMYVGINSGGVYKSDASNGANQGTIGTWTKLTVPLSAGFDRVEIAAGQDNPDKIYAVTGDFSSTGNVVVTSNGGQTWSVCSGQPNGGSDYSNGQAWYDLCIEVNPANANEVWTGAIDQYRTTNGGGSWTRRTAAYGGGGPYIHPDQHAIVFRPNNPGHIIFGNDGGIWYTTNSASSLNERNNGYNVTQFYSLSVNPQAGSNNILGGTQDNGSWIMTQTGIGPGTDVSGGDGAFACINTIYPDTLFTTSQYATIYRSRNNGATVNYFGNWNLNDNDVLFINPLEIDPINPENLYQASRALWRHSTASTGSAGAWTQATKEFSGNITAIACSPSEPNLVYFASGSIYRFANAHTGNWTSNPPTVNSMDSPSGYISCIAINPVDANHIVVTITSFGSGIKVSECRNADQGANAVWKDLTGNLPDLPVNWAVFEPNNNNGLLIGTDFGAFRCADITQASADIFWSPEHIGMGIPRVDMLETRQSDNMVFAATHGRGFWSTNSYNLSPVANFGVMGDTVCGGMVAFVDSSENAPTGWFWDFGDGTTSTMSNPVHEYTTSGNYTVSLTVTNPNGTDSTTSSYNFYVLPPAVATAGPDLTACNGDTVILTATGGVSYSWYPDANVINPTSDSASWVVTGTRTFYVTATDSNGCSALDTLIVNAAAGPNVWAGQDQYITVPGDSVQLEAVGADSFSWSPSTGLSCTNCPDPMAGPDTTIVYTVTGWNAAGCSNTDNVTVHYNLVGVDDGLSGGYALLAPAPNPAADATQVRIRLPKAGDVTIELIDMNGRKVDSLFSGRQSAGDHVLNWTRKGQSAGIYFIRMEVDGQRFVRKLVLK